MCCSSTCLATVFSFLSRTQSTSLLDPMRGDFSSAGTRFTSESLFPASVESSHIPTRAGASWSGGKGHHLKLSHHLIECLAQSRYQKTFFRGSFKPASAFSTFSDKLCFGEYLGWDWEQSAAWWLEAVFLSPEQLWTKWTETGHWGCWWGWGGWPRESGAWGEERRQERSVYCASAQPI